MGMFDNYDYLDETPQPNNMFPKPPVHEIITNYDTVTKEFNIKGQCIGYKWDYGNSISINFTINKPIRIPDDAIVYVNVGKYPTAETLGYIGRKCYNLVDVRSWTCTDIYNIQGVVTYEWTMDDDIVTYSDNTREVELTPDMTNKTLMLDFRDWRHESVYTVLAEDSSVIAFVLTKEQSAEKFIRGVYTCTVSIVSDTDCIDVEKINFRVV